MSRKSWGSLLIVLGIILIGVAGYAMAAWEEAVEMGEAMGIPEYLLEEGLRQPGAAQAMASVMPSGGEFWYYAVLYRNPIMVAGIVSLLAGIVCRSKKEKQPEPWAKVEPHESPVNVPVKPAPAPVPVKPAPAPAPVKPAPVAQANSRTLTGKDGALAGRSFKVGGKVVIGRSSSHCQIVYPADTKGVSGIHCTVRFNGTTVTVTDENSSYGTFIDGVRLTPGHATTMHRGQLLQLGSTKQSLQLRS